MSAAAKSFVILLREHLEAEIAAHRRLLALAEAREKAVVANDRLAIEKLNHDEAVPAAEAARLRSCRERLVLGLAERLAVPPGEVRLSRLIELLPEPNRRELADRRAELQALLSTLRDQVERNHALLRTSLSLVQGILKRIAGGRDDAPRYDRRGGMLGDQQARGGLVDALG